MDKIIRNWVPLLACPAVLIQRSMMAPLGKPAVTPREGFGVAAWRSIILSVVFIASHLQTRADDKDSKPVLSDVQHTMQRFVDDGQISGGVTLVAHRGEIVHLGAVGQADLATGRPMTTDTIFWIASMTKPLTATALMMQEDAGDLNVDDPVSKYIPEFAELTLEETGQPVATTLTIRHLLTHTNGLGRLQKPDGGHTDSLEVQAHKLAEIPLQFEPGSKWQYGSGLDVVGRIIEIVSGLPYDEFLRRRLIDPLGMVDTTFRLNADQARRVATVYRIDKQTGALTSTPNRHASPDPDAVVTPSPSGGLYATAEDMFHFYQMVLNGGHSSGRYVSINSVSKMTSIQTDSLVTGFTPGNGWGLGWCVIREPQGITRSLSPGTFGHGGAYGTQGWVDPEREMIFVLMIQRSDLPNSDGSEIRQAFQDAAVRTVVGE